MAFRKLLQITLLLNSCVSVLEAQELFPDSLTPGFRGDTGTEYSEWDIFFDPYLGPNFGDVAAATSAPTITQDLNPSAFITSSFNIYDFAGQVGFTLQNDVSATIGASAGPVNTIVLQLQSQGNFFDYDTIQLNYGPSYSNSVSPVNLISESRVILGGFGGFVNKVALQWDLTGLGIEDYTITFRSASSSTSLDIAELDVSTGAFSEIVPGTRTWDGGAGNTQWSSAANWSGDDLGLDSATVVFNNTAPVAVDLNVHREVGQLNLDRDGTFTLSSSNGSTLTLNTGISLAGATGTAAEITADIFMGGHNFIDVDAGNTLTLNTVVSGDGAIGLLPATGIFKSGTGALVLSQNNTFTGGVEVNEGTLIVEGANAYTGPTVIFRGQFVARTDAPDGSAGALGNATSNITVGSGSFFGSTGNLGIEDAELIIDGAFEVGRNIDFTGGTDGKRLAGRNTGLGATFSGALALGASADNVKLDAEGASDSVSFTGSITGGSSAAGQSVIINSGSSQGAVVFAGSNKTYQNDTVINAGTLVIDSGTAYTGAGNWEVITGASLVVDGELSGSGSLVLNGGTLQGSGLVSKALTVDTGDVLSPGNSPGRLNFGSSQTWADGGTYLWEINDVDAGTGTGWDVVDITGSLDVTATIADPFVIEITSLSLLNAPDVVHDFDDLSSYTWTLLETTAGITGFNTDSFLLDTSGFVSVFTGTFAIDQLGDDLVINYTAVPEPGTVGLLAAALTWLSIQSRRRVYKVGI